MFHFAFRFVLYFFRMEIEFDLPFVARVATTLRRLWWQQFVDWNAAAKLLKAPLNFCPLLWHLTSDTWHLPVALGVPLCLCGNLYRWNSCLINRSQLSATLFPFRTLPSSLLLFLVLTACDWFIRFRLFAQQQQQRQQRQHIGGPFVLATSAIVWFVACLRHVLRSQRPGVGTVWRGVEWSCTVN